ncbi:hypothetical protein GGR55DRAFT_673719 [Xylaria sp. FL0064]|nr:hypothetical protein GGR55DRAFT_673719 [Xylaria sp. FL0064]
MVVSSSKPFLSPSSAFCNNSASPTPGLVRVPVSNFYGSPHDRPDVNTTYVPERCIWSFGRESLQAIHAEIAAKMDKLSIAIAATTQNGHFLSRRLWRNGTMDLESMNQFMGALSDVMTADMRSHGGARWDSDGEWARGPALEQRTCVSICWAWISYPASLVFIAIVWTEVLVWQSPRSEATRKEWRSSSLALLMARIGDDKTEEENVPLPSMSSRNMNQKPEDACYLEPPVKDTEQRTEFFPCIAKSKTILQWAESSSDASPPKRLARTPYDFHFPPRINVGYPSSGNGVRVYKFSEDRMWFGEEGVVKPYLERQPDGWYEHINMALDADERCEVLRSFGARFYETVDDCDDIPKTLEEGYEKGKAYELFLRKIEDEDYVDK